MSDVRVAILYPTDPAGSVPSGIDSFIKGFLKWSPDGLQYTLFGATSDAVARPVGRPSQVRLGDRTVQFVPLVTLDSNARRGLVPLTVRYLAALVRWSLAGRLADYDVLDFHRIEPLLLFLHDRRPKNVLIHQDMAVLRNADTDILWRHAPGVYERLERFILRRVDKSFCVRETAVQRYRESMPSIASRFEFIPTWVDTAVFRPPASEDERAAAIQSLGAQVGAGAAARFVLFVGRLDRQKDPMLLLDSFASLARQRGDLHLVVVGDGSLRQKVEERIAELGLAGRVHLLGPRPAAEIAALLRGADLFLLTSAYEGMPIAVLEALASGVPVVSTAVGEIGRVVHEGVNGALVQVRGAEALAGAAARVLDGGAQLRGEPCVSAIVPFRPAGVLGRLFDNHRAQGAGATK